MPGHSKNRNRKIIVYIATSADGFIARPDGDVAWLERKRPKGNYGYGAFFKSIDTILWGRKTYDKGIEMGMQASQFGPKVRNYVFSSGAAAALGAPPSGVHFEFVNEPLKTFAERLRTQPGKNIWMMGGGGIIASFLDAEEIDEFQINVVPVLIGEGIPLIAPRHRLVRLKLLEATPFADGLVRLHYAVPRGA